MQTSLLFVALDIVDCLLNEEMAQYVWITLEASEEIDELEWCDHDIQFQRSV